MEKDSSWDDLGLGMTPEECRELLYGKGVTPEQKKRIMEMLGKRLANGFRAKLRARKETEPDKERILDLLGALVTQNVRDRAISRTVREINGEYVHPDERVLNGYRKMSPESQAFLKERLLPYFVDAAVKEFLNFLGDLGKESYSFKGGKPVRADVTAFSSNSICYALVYRQGNSEMFSVDELTADKKIDLGDAPACQNPGAPGWNERFSRYPSSGVYNKGLAGKYGKEA